jgi:HK97 family phage major capsid protein
VTVSKETGQAADTILADNIEKMFARMPASMLSGAEWFINQDCWPQIFQLSHVIGTGGAPVYMRDIQGSPFGSLLGRPVTPIEHASTVGSLGDIVFANLNAGYIMADKGGVKQASSLHVRFLYDEQVLRFTYRVDGQPKYSSAITPYQGTNTLSPFVALAARD